MRKIVMFNMVTLDGYFEGPNRDISWHNAEDQEFNDFAVQQLDETDGIIFGRKTYEMMAAYWGSPSALRDDPIIAQKMISTPKYVFSRTYNDVTWDNSYLVKGEFRKEVEELMQLPGNILCILGSADLVASFAEHNLIDEYRIMVNPVILGRGRPLFEETAKHLKLELTSSRKFNSGNMLLYYKPEKISPHSEFRVSIKAEFE